MSSSKPTIDPAPATEKVKPARRKAEAAPLAAIETKAEMPKAETPKPAAAAKAPEPVKAPPAKAPPVKAVAEKMPTVTVPPALVRPAPVAIAPAPIAAKPAPVPAAPIIATPAEPAKTVAAASEKRLKNLASDLAPEPGKVKKMNEIPSVKGYEELTAISKANLDALVQANKVFAQGVEAISKEAMSLTQSSLESAATAAKAMFAAKTLQDVVELNTSLTRAYFDRMFANSTKLGEMSIKLATDTMAPITARVNTAVETAIKHNPVEKMIKPAA